METMESHGSERRKSGWLIALALELLGSFFRAWDTFVSLARRLIVLSLEPVVPFFYNQCQPIKPPGMTTPKADSLDAHVDANTSDLQEIVTFGKFLASEHTKGVSDTPGDGEPGGGSLASRVPRPLAPSSMSNGSTVKSTPLASASAVSPPNFTYYPIPLHKDPLLHHAFIADDMLRVHSTIAEDPFLMRLTALFLANDVEIETSREIQDLRKQCDSLEQSFDTAYAEFSKALALVRDVNAKSVLIVEGKRTKGKSSRVIP